MLAVVVTSHLRSLLLVSEICDPNPCFRGGDCVLVDGRPQCAACPDGYQGDGIRCDRIIRCVDRPCFEGVDCMDTSTGFRCGACPRGFTGDGTRFGCRRMQPSCADSPCFLGVRCQDTERGYRCGPCPPGQISNPFRFLAHSVIFFNR